MQSHDNAEHMPQSNVINQFLERLRERASTNMQAGQSSITAGKPGEQELDSWNVNNFHVRQMPDDEQGILRISIGGGSPVVELNYCVFRGDRLACINLLRSAINALEGRPRQQSKE